MSVETPDYSLLPYLRQLQNATGSSSLKDEKLCQLVQALDSGLGKDQLLYEFSPGRQGIQIDLACWLPAIKSSHFMPEACSKVDMPDAWKQVVSAVADAGTRTRWPGWKGIWFEFDSHSSKPKRPNVFFSFAGGDRSNHVQIQKIISLIKKHTGISVAVQRKLAELTGQISSVNIVQIGFLLPRGTGDRVKVCLSNLSYRDFKLLQNKLQFPVSSKVMAVWEEIALNTSNWVLALDVFPDQETRPAFEIQPAASPFSTRYAWQPILDHLSALASNPLSADLAHGHIQSCVNSSQWPPALIYEWQQRAEIVDSLMLTSLNHVKLYDGSNEKPMLKYYYLQQPVQKTQWGTYERPSWRL